MQNSLKSCPRKMNTGNKNKTLTELFCFTIAVFRSLAT